MGQQAFSIKYSCACDIGHSRTENQDNFFCDGVFLKHDGPTDRFALAGEVKTDVLQMFGVFDGMGGEECGDVAAFIAAREAAEFRPEEVSVKELKKFCFQVNQKICRYAEEYEIYSMGTTAAFLVFREEAAFLCNIGDSKIFWYGGKTLKQISIDHLAPAPFGRKRPLSQNLGIPEDVMVIDPYIAELSYNKEDIFLICSDGLTDMVSPVEIRKIAAECAVQELAPKLVARALEKGGRDNVTVIAAQLL